MIRGAIFLNSANIIPIKSDNKPLCRVFVFPTVVYICGPPDTFLNIMKLFQSEIPDPENYAIFYLDVFAESLTERKPWLNNDSLWIDPIKVFKVNCSDRELDRQRHGDRDIFLPLFPFIHYVLLI